MSKILLACHEKSTSDILTKLLKTEGYRVHAFSDLSQAMASVSSGGINLIITMAAENFDPELKIIKLALEKAPGIPVIAITEPNNHQLREMAEKCKPYALIEKPLKVDLLLTTVQQAIDFADKALTENVNLNLQLEKIYQFENIIAESPAMKSVCDMISRVAGINVTILLTGASGTGKREIAETIHANSPRANNQFIIVDCNKGTSDADLFGTESQPGALELAAGGTILFREIGALALPAQNKLVQAMKDGNLACSGKNDVSVDVRFIATSSENLEQLTHKGSFSPDLFKMIKVILIKILPLKDRPQDIMPTIRQILQKKVGKGRPLPGLDPDIIPVLEKYSWPRNIDDIEQVLDEILPGISGNKITKSSLPARILSH